MNNLNVNDQQYGDIKISDEVIATIASVATKEVNGISGLSLSFASEIASKITKKNLSNAIKITTEGNSVTIDISVIVEYGIRIPDVSWEVQQNVKKAVETMSDLNVNKVNIIVAGVEFESTQNDDTPNQ